MGQIGSAQGQWQGKALIRDLKRGKNGVIDLEILAREPSQLRMELVGPFGVHVASIALNGEEVRYILSREKKFVSATSADDALGRLVPVRIAPKALLAVLFDRELPAKEWKCDRDGATNLAKFCAHTEERIGVRWLERNGRSRRLKILSTEAEIEMVLDEAKSKVEMNDSAFVLNAPSGYKQERQR